MSAFAMQGHNIDYDLKPGAILRDQHGRYHQLIENNEDNLYTFISRDGDHLVAMNVGFTDTAYYLRTGMWHVCADLADTNFVLEK